MSNLGFYQTITKVIKSVGGPKRFLGIGMAVAGGIGVVGGMIGYKICKASSPKSIELKSDILASELFTVTSNGVDEQGLKFCTGEKYRVLGADKDSILIEKMDDSDNPYYVSAGFLKKISDFEKVEDHDL